MEAVLAVIPANEIWGINHKSPCNLVISGERVVVVKGAGKGTIRPGGRKNQGSMKAYLRGDHYSLPFKSIRWVEIRHHLLGAAVKVGTPGGSYRFRLRRRASRQLADRLKQVLGEKVREKGR